MDSEKQYESNSETSTEESDQRPEKSSDEISGGSRFYECTFCKRGFTNAQALGGHMNIHRKEKAKTKPKAKKGGVSARSQEDAYRDSIPSSYSNYSSDQAQYYGVPFEAQQMNYQLYYPPSNPNFPVAYHMISDFPAQRSDHHHHHLGLYDDYIIPKLSLKIDGTHHEVASGSMIGSWKENEIDLELRL